MHYLLIKVQFYFKMIITNTFNHFIISFQLLGEQMMTVAKVISSFVWVFILLGNCLAQDGLTTESLKATQRNIIETVSSVSLSDPVELCLTWWLLNRRFYKNCVITISSKSLESNSEFMNCINEIKQNISPDTVPTITILKVHKGEQCGSHTNMTVDICLVLLKEGKLEGYPWPTTIEIASQQRYLIHMDRNIMSIRNLLLQIAVTPLINDTCEDFFGQMKMGGSVGVSNLIPATQSNCIIQENRGMFYGEYCLEKYHVENTAIKSEDNCSLSEYSVGLKPLFSKSQCDVVKLKAFCIVEYLPHNNHYDIVYTFCSRILLPIEKNNITNWKFKTAKECFVQFPFTRLTNRANYTSTDFTTIDINDEDILHKESICAIYSGDLPYSASTKLSSYYSQMIMSILAATGLFFNILALISVVYQTENGSVKVYIIALVLSNMIVATNSIIQFVIGMTPFFHESTCSIDPIIHRIFTDMSLLVMLGLSVERTIAVSKPLLIKSWCTASRARKVSYSRLSNRTASTAFLYVKTKVKFNVMFSYKQLS